MGRPQVTLSATLGTNGGGWGEAEFNNPSALACDYQGSLVVADTDNHRIVKLDAQGNYLWSLGRRDSKGVPVPGTAQEEFDSPQGICTDPDNNIYVADSRNARVQKFSPEGEFQTIFGTWGNEDGMFGGEGPLGVAVDDKGFILVSDSHTAQGGNHRIQKFDPHGRYVNQFGSYGTGLGQFGGAVPVRHYGFDFGPGIGPGPIGPAGIVVNTDKAAVLERNVLGGDIFCADCDNDRIACFFGNGVPTANISAGTLFRPRQLALDVKGRLYASGVHMHEPPMSVQGINEMYNWRIERECAWIWTLDAKGRELGGVGTPEAHDMMEHRPGAGLHSHGYGLATSRTEESIVYVQGGNLIFKFEVGWDTPGGTI